MEGCDGAKLHSDGRGSYLVLQKRPRSDLPVRASVAGVRRRRIHSRRRRSDAGEDHSFKLRRFQSHPLPQRQARSSLLRSQGNYWIHGIGNSQTVFLLARVFCVLCFFFFSLFFSFFRLLVHRNNCTTLDYSR